MRILILFFLTIFISCSAQTDKQDKFENQICDCVDSSYDSIGVDFKQELLDFEKHLIETDQLENSDGESYYKIFKTIVAKGDIPIKTDYSIDKFTPDNFVIYAKCFYSQFDNPKLEDSDSKLKDLYRDFKRLSGSGNINPKSAAEVIINVLDADDFEKELYKFYALNTFYYTASTNGFTSFNDTEVIEIDITENQDVFLNGIKVDIDSISNKIIEITSEYSDEEKEKYRINLTVDKDVKMGVVTDVKLQLREANALRINYKAK